MLIELYSMMTVKHRCRLSFEMNFLVTEKFSLVCFFHPRIKIFYEPVSTRHRQKILKIVSRRTA